jgi:hypothetical protein
MELISRIIKLKDDAHAKNNLIHSCSRREMIDYYIEEFGTDYLCKMGLIPNITCADARIELIMTDNALCLEFANYICHRICDLVLPEWSYDTRKDDGFISIEEVETKQRICDDFINDCTYSFAFENYWGYLELRARDRYNRIINNKKLRKDFIRFLMERYYKIIFPHWI